MDVFYLTADRIGAPTGGGAVTYHEAQALSEFGQCEAWEFPDAERPWGSDGAAWERLVARTDYRPALCHIYAGCFTATVNELKARGCKVVYTVAAHDRRVSREEHEALGMAFPYPHLTDDTLWRQYIGGILAADVVVVPGEAPRRVLEREGVDPGRIRVIPHGHTQPDRIAPMPHGFHVGYLGACTPDKGLRYLIAAWAKLNYPDAVLHIAGTNAPDLWPMVREAGRGNFNLRGYLPSASMLYNSVNLYVQPSATEGFGIEVVEAMAHGRPVICSKGAGAAAWASETCVARDVNSLAGVIHAMRERMAGWGDPANLPPLSTGESVAGLTWDHIRERYKGLWAEVMA